MRCGYCECHETDAMDTDHGVILWEEKPFCLRRPRTFCAQREAAVLVLLSMRIQS